MLDKLNLSLIKNLNDLCDESAAYKILEITHILERMTKFKMDYEMLNNNLNYLQDHEFIDIKYLDEKEVCLALLTKARVHSEEVKAMNKEKNKYFKLALWSSVSSFIAAFMGGFLANLMF